MPMVYAIPWVPSMSGGELAGVTEPAVIAQLACGRMRPKIPGLEQVMSPFEQAAGRWLKRPLAQRALAAGRKNGSFLQGRQSARRGRKRAVIALAHSQLTAIYEMLKTRRSIAAWELATWTNCNVSGASGTC
jgi:hypothetical protein